MKLNIRTVILCALLIGSLALCGCGVRGTRPSTTDTINPAQQTADVSSSPVPTASPSSTPAIQVTPAPLVTPKPSVSPTPAVSAQPGTGTQQTPIPTAAPQQTPIPTAAPAASGLPVVTKSPTSETVAPGGSCWFVAKYKDAIYAEWHFVSPDGKRDLDYSQAAKEFPTLEIVDGYASSMQLKNIPASLNGWNVYCRFSNKVGAVVTAKASITVTGSQQNQTSGAPLVTKNPTGETVAPGGACSFVARYNDAIWAEWHFVSPDGSRDLVYTQAANEFPGLSMTGADTSVLKLSSIPSSLNGWSVYCRFTNNYGAANTTRAGITVTGGSGGSGGQAYIIPDNSGSTAPGGQGYPYPGGSSDPGSPSPGGSGSVVPGDPGSPNPSGSGTVVPGDPSDPYPGGSGSGTPGDPGSPGVIIIG